MRSSRGSTLVPLLSGLAFVAAVTGGFIAGRKHPVRSRDAITTHGEWVKFPNGRGDSVRAYVAYPERSDKAPTLIVVHEIFGLTDWEPTMGDRFAAKGYIAVVPDLLSSRYGISPPSADSSRKLIATLTDAGVIADLDAAYKYVNALPAAQQDNTGIIGFCWGGATVWKYAAANPRVKAAVPCYGPVSDSTILTSITAPVLGVFGQNDMRVNSMIPVEKRLLGERFVADSYMGTGHGFLKPGRNGYGSAEYDRALRNIDAFFARQLDHKK